MPLEVTILSLVEGDVPQYTVYTALDSGRTAIHESAVPEIGSDVLSLKSHVHARPVDRRPAIAMKPTDHPLALEQRSGITLARTGNRRHAAARLTCPSSCW